MKIAGVSAAWDRPDDARAVLVLAHGAGGDLNDPFLRGLGASLAEAGIATVRFNFPYRESGRKAPGAQSQSEDCYREIVTHVRAEGVPTFCGGKSYGGRVATHIAADVPMSGLVLLSYPLHPPGKPERLRDAHLADVSAPMLFVQGSRDPFATPALLDKTVRSLDAATLVHVEGGDHSLNVRGRPRADVVDEVSAIVRGFVARI